MNTYKLMSHSDGNDCTPLESKTFQEATDEALARLGWYVLDEGDHFVGINDFDSANTIELTEQSFEDAQYELLANVGFFITTPVTNEI